MILFVALMMLSGMFGSAGVTSRAPVEYREYRDVFLAIDIPRGSSRDGPESFGFQHGGELATFGISISTPYDVYTRRVDCGGHPASYRVNRPNLFAYSCLVGQRIKYHVEKYGRSYRVGLGEMAHFVTELIEFTITYPASQRNFWDPVVSHMSRTLRFPAARRRV